MRFPAITVVMIVASATAPSAQPLPKTPIIAWTLRQTPGGSLEPGDATALKLVAKIEKGWHLYSIDQPEGGPIATQITLAGDQPFDFSGPIVGPKPHVIFDPNFGMRVGLYTGTVEFALPVRVRPGAGRGDQLLAVEIRYQACNDEICLPPKTTRVPYTVRIGSETPR